MKAMNSILPSTRLILSYIFDWIVIIAIAAVGAGWEYLTPFHRPFSPVDLSISYPFETNETIPTWLLILVALIAPAAIIFFVCLIFVPGPTASKGTPKSLIWRRKLWEWNTGWMGLAMSLATAFMLTQGMKLLFGKPRPDFLSRCRPDLNRIAEFAVNPVGEDFNPLWVLVTSGICQNRDDDILQDGFKSFPSGHSSFSWAGLLYLTLFLASKFSVAIPFLPPRQFSTNPAFTSAVTPSNLRSKIQTLLPTHNKHHIHSSLSTGDTEDAVVPIRYQAAAPPVWCLVLVLVPIGSAIYISSTRFTDFRHQGFDILFGSFIGITSSWFSFRWYHLPVTRGAGWSWGPRSYTRAWGIGVGVGSYVGTEGWSGRKDGRASNATGQSGADELELVGMRESQRSERTVDERRVEGVHAI